MNNNFIIILLICFIGFCAYKLIEGFIIDFGYEKLRLESSYPKLVKEVLYYCAPIFKQKKIKYYPLSEISYFETKIKLGCYFSGKKKIVIYIKRHSGSETEKLRQIVHTILHEAQHYCQHMTDPNFENYDIYNKKLTYQKNPFEIDSNKFADEHIKKCIIYLKQKGILS